MLDPLTALSVASSVIQFVDFGSKFLIEAYGSYKSARGLSENSVEIQYLADDLDSLTSRIAISHTAADGELDKIAQKCQDVARELSKLLSDLRITSHGSLRSWDAIRQTVKKIRKKDKLETLQRRLEAIRSQMTTHILLILRDGQSQSSQIFQDLITKTDELQLENRQFFLALRQDVIANIEKSRTECGDFRQNLKEDYAAAVQRLEASTQQTVNALDNICKGAGAVATISKILETLVYPEMPIRHHEIRHAHPETFGWIFEENTTNFKSWLEDGTGIFWINGKAGSGKSTLMKFLDGHPQTTELLETWANGKKLVIGKFYFWNAGYPMQRSQEGLLQSLLLQVLRQIPELVPKVFPERWAADESFFLASPPWRRYELLNALEIVLSTQQLSTNFCFFIDGLDEYEGDPVELIERINKVAMSTSIKICVSSRPWTEFKDAYGKDPHKRLFVLQDLTRPDMYRFAHGQLQENQRFAQLSRQDTAAQDLLVQLLDKAQGVFLWVFLVVRSLLRGLSKHDDISVLQKRLDELPSGLEEFFNKMMNSIEPVYRDQAARLMQLAVRTTPLPIVTIQYLEQERPNFEPALNGPLRKIPSDELDGFIDKSISQVNAWCRDLMEVLGPPTSEGQQDRNRHVHYQVGFLHRTVRDFMNTSGMQAWLDSHIGVGFDPHWTLLAIHVYQARTLTLDVVPWNNFGRFPESWNAFYGTVKEAMLHAREFEAYKREAPTELLDEIDRVGILSWQSHTCTLSLHWASGLLGGKEGNFLALTAAYGLVRYVKSRFDTEREPPDNRARSLLLDFVLQARREQQERLQPSGEVLYEMVKTLLNNGADPNLKMYEHSANRTPWQRFLRKYYEDPRQMQYTGRTINISEPSFEDRLFLCSSLVSDLLLHHGARADVKIQVMVPLGQRRAKHPQSQVECISVEKCLRLGMKNRPSIAQRISHRLLLGATMDFSERNDDDLDCYS